MPVSEIPTTDPEYEMECQLKAPQQLPRGDLYIKFDIQFPTSIDEDKKA